MSKNLLKTLQDHLRPTSKSFYLFAPVSIAALPFAFSFREDAPAVLYLLFLGVLITAPTFIVFWLFGSLIRKFEGSNNLYANVAQLVVTGISRGIIFYYVLELASINNPSPLLGRILNSTFTVLLWLGIASILLESNHRFKRKYRALVTQILILKLRAGEKPDPGYALLAREIARMQLNIRDTLQDRHPEVKDEEHARQLALSLRNEIEHSLKPLSQRLWVKSLYTPPSAKVSALISSAITDLNYSFALAAGIYALANVVNTTQSLGLNAGVLFALGTYIAFSIAEVIRRYLCSRYIKYSASINIVFVFLVGLLVGLIVNLVFSYLNLNYSYGVAIFTSPSLPALIVAIACITLALRDRDALMENLRTKVARQKSADLDLVSHSNAASYLHNSLQSELTALALQLDSLASNPDPERNRVVMEKLEALVSQSKSEDFNNFMETPEARLMRVVNSWDGIAEIDLNIDPLIWKDSSRSSIVVSLIQEAVANSVRSGRANRVDVVGEYSKDSIFVTVTDNGSAQVTTDRRGIGSQWIDRIAISDWKLEETDKGRVLRVEI